MVGLVWDKDKVKIKIKVDMGDGYVSAWDWDGCLCKFYMIVGSCIFGGIGLVRGIHVRVCIGTS